MIGPVKKTVVSLDCVCTSLQNYKMARDDFDHLILCPGELHIEMAQLCSIGAYIENSGIDFSWTEADLYGNASVTDH